MPQKGTRVRAYVKDTRAWIDVKVTRVSVSSFQGIDDQSSVHKGLNQWVDPEAPAPEEEKPEIPATSVPIKADPQLKELAKSIRNFLKTVGSATNFEISENLDGATMPEIKQALKWLAQEGAIALTEPELDLLQASLQVLVVSKSRSKLYEAPAMASKAIERITAKQVVLEGGAKRGKDKVWFLASSFAFEKAQELHEAWNKAFKSLGKQLRDLGNYRETLDAQGLKNTPNPLTPYAISYTNPDGYCADYYLDDWNPPIVELNATKRHTACKVEVSRVKRESWMLSDSSGYACCPDLETWEKVEEARSAVIAAQEAFQLYLSDSLGTYADFEELESRALAVAEDEETEPVTPENRAEEILQERGWEFSNWFEPDEMLDLFEDYEGKLVDRVDNWLVTTDTSNSPPCGIAWNSESHRTWYWWGAGEVEENKREIDDREWEKKDRENSTVAWEKIDREVAKVRSLIAQAPYNSPGQLALPIETDESGGEPTTLEEATSVPLLEMKVGALVRVRPDANVEEDMTWALNQVAVVRGLDSRTASLTFPHNYQLWLYCDLNNLEVIGEEEEKPAPDWGFKNGDRINLKHLPDPSTIKFPPTKPVWEIGAIVQMVEWFDPRNYALQKATIVEITGSSCVIQTMAGQTISCVRQEFLQTPARVLTEWPEDPIFIVDGIRSSRLQISFENSEPFECYAGDAELATTVNIASYEYDNEADADEDLMFGVEEESEHYDEDSEHYEPTPASEPSNEERDSPTDATDSELLVFSIGTRILCRLYNDSVPGTITQISDEEIATVAFDDGNTGKYSMEEISLNSEILPSSEESAQELPQITVRTEAGWKQFLRFEESGIFYLDLVGEKFINRDYAELQLEDGTRLPQLPYPVKTWLNPGSVNLNQGTQSRIEILDHATVREYATEMREGRWEWQKSPPVVFWDGEKLYPCGHHRIAAAKLAQKEILCVVRPGTLRDAKRLSAVENKFSSLKRTNADKLNATRLFISTLIEEYGSLAAIPLSKGGASIEGQWSARKIADEVGVSHTYAKSVWREFENTAAIEALGVASADVDATKARIRKGDRLGVIRGILLNQERPLQIAWDNAGTTYEDLEGVEIATDPIPPEPGIEEIKQHLDIFGFSLLTSKDGRFAIETIGKSWVFQNAQELHEWLAVDWPVVKTRYGKAGSQVLKEQAALSSVKQELAQQAAAIGLSNGSQVLPTAKPYTAPDEVDDRPGAYRPEFNPQPAQAALKTPIAEEFLIGFLSHIEEMSADQLGTALSRIGDRLKLNHPKAYAYIQQALEELA